jgi:3-oxoacyl-[acyl-carrier-protein] synthase III
MSDPIGISAIELFIPEGRMTVADMAALSHVAVDDLLAEVGVETKPVRVPERPRVDMALHAVHGLFAAHRVDPRAVDYVIHASCGLQDRYLWSPAAKIQKEIAALGAFSFDVSNGCNAGNLGLALAVKLLRTDESKSTALVVVCDALSEIVDYGNKDHTCIFNFSDAAAAILVKKGEPRNQVLAFAARTIAEFADHMSVPRTGGPVDMGTDEAEDRALSKAYKTIYPEMIVSALRMAGLGVRDIDHLFMNQGDYKLIQRIADTLELPAEKVHRTYQRHGHLGGSDPFFGLKQTIDAGRIHPGEIIVLASSAIGFSWGATVIRA